MVFFKVLIDGSTADEWSTAELPPLEDGVAIQFSFECHLKQGSIISVVVDTDKLIRVDHLNLYTSEFFPDSGPFTASSSGNRVFAPAGTETEIGRFCVNHCEVEVRAHVNLLITLRDLSLLEYIASEI